MGQAHHKVQVVQIPGQGSTTSTIPQATKMSLRQISAALRRRNSLILLLCLVAFYLLWFQLAGVRLLEGSGHPHSDQWEERVAKELYAMRLQASEMRRQLTRLGSAPAHWRHPDLPTIFVVTPTHAIPTQKADLVRLSNTLLHVPNLHWLIVEDADHKSELVSRLLRRSGLVYTHLSVATPPELKLQPKDPRWKKPRGVLQRNAALSWLRENLEIVDANGVVYFADDDNTYSLELFTEMRDIQSVGVWPVGLVGGVMVERPLVDNGRVTGWLTPWRPDRAFATDMAGFAVNVRLVLNHPTASFSIESQRGFLETDLLTQMGVTLDDLEVKADLCTKVLVWHTQTAKADLKIEKIMEQKGKPATNVGIEV
ncbi:galactosylgalactosylxylosylprotein 3-beta-glucuronosyltransferase I-like isoform X1 [Amphibalanus amphitrite]|uniref:galactosylgalactosylxylosylprotein 3-beta-glucuronosyltransferase I-like isoform X1 n=2 Tax=Amphibalanus amphitrite TaxID=1232801 RepID=UPI001C9244D6|nr:galactosylgalactosylxylosylprotein 3-beta-glucuronosyltransferase I-like isoform X1 [Amphibalanus amphitrite]